MNNKKLKIGDLVYIIGPQKECLGGKECCIPMGNACDCCPGFEREMNEYIKNIKKIIGIDGEDYILNLEYESDEYSFTWRWHKNWLIKIR